MHTGRTFDTEQKIHLYDGYQGEPIWQQEDNNSTYYNYGVDKQCRVPIRDIGQIKEELGITT